MQQIKDYIFVNWTWLFPVILSVVESFLIIILKKKPVFNLEDRTWCLILYSLPTWIKEAEADCKDGYNKMAYVLNKAIKLYPSIFSNQHALRNLRSVVEDVLSTPQKKGE